jgi:lysophospholipase L1-like esterase
MRVSLGVFAVVVLVSSISACKSSVKHSDLRQAATPPASPTAPACEDGKGGPLDSACDASERAAAVFNPSSVENTALALTQGATAKCPVMGQITELVVSGSDENATATVYGWAQHPGDPAKAAAVELFLDGESTTCAGQIGAASTSLVDKGLNAFCGFPESSAHVFTAKIPLAYVKDVHLLRAYVRAGTSQATQFLPFAAVYTTQGVVANPATWPRAGGAYGGDPAYLRTWRNSFNVLRDCMQQDMSASGYNALFLGDSITEGWGNPVPSRAPESAKTKQYEADGTAKTVSCRDLGEKRADPDANAGLAQWERSFDAKSRHGDEAGKPAGFDARNGGLAGDTTDGLLYRITADTVDVETPHGQLDKASAKPNMVYLLIGTNNMAAGHSGDMTAQGVRAIVNVIRARSPATKILVLSVLAKGLWTSTDETTPFNGQYINMIHGPYKATPYGYTGELYQDDGTGVNDKLRGVLALGASYALPSPRDANVYYLDLNYGKYAANFMWYDASTAQWIVNPAYFKRERCLVGADGANLACGFYLHPNAAGYDQLAASVRQLVWTLGTAP